MEIIVDRIENAFAVCETESGSVDIPLSEINGSPETGDILVRCGERYDIDENATRERRRKIIELQDKLWK